LTIWYISPAITLTRASGKLGPEAGDSPSRSFLFGFDLVTEGYAYEDGQGLNYDIAVIPWLSRRYYSDMAVLLSGKVLVGTARGDFEIIQPSGVFQEFTPHVRQTRTSSPQDLYQELPIHNTVDIASNHRLNLPPSSLSA
jgi:hypothetical protein